MYDCYTLVIGERTDDGRVKVKNITGMGLKLMQEGDPAAYSIPTDYEGIFYRDPDADLVHQ